MEKPVLLTKTELIQPVIHALARITEIKYSITSSDNKMVLHGVFVLAVSSFENALIDSLGIVFKYIPDRLGIENDAPPLKIKDLIEGQALDKIIEKRLRSIAYMNVEDILEKYIQHCRIGKGSILNDIDKLKEIKATRNLLIHNNLKNNSTYKETAGPLKRSSGRGNELVVDFNYLQESTQVLIDILTSIQNEIEITYKDYTRLRAIEALFKFILPTPIMKLQDEFYILPKEDTIGGINEETSSRGGLSSSEEFIYDMFVVNSSHVEVKVPFGIFHKLGYNSQEKITFLMKSIDVLKS